MGKKKGMKYIGESRGEGEQQERLTKSWGKGRNFRMEDTGRIE